MPVTHDGDDWKELNRTVSRIDGDLRVLSEKQERQHRENVVRMDRIEVTQKELQDDVTEIKQVMSEVKGVLVGVKAVGKILAWLLGIVIALQSVYMLFGPNIRKSVGVPNSSSQQPPAVSQNKSSEPQSAHIPIL